MEVEAHFLDVKIMGREYRVACTPDERDALLSAVEMVDGRMRDIAQRTRNTIAERVAVMAALNIAHEHLSAPRTSLEPLPAPEDSLASSEAKRRIDAMGARLDSVLGPQSQLDL